MVNFKLKDNTKILVTWPLFLKKKTGRILLLVVILASATMIIMNYYTIKILSTARAYINGESQYSKGQKNASAHLINYIYLENPFDYAAFEQNISIPEGDRIARIALSGNYDHDRVKKGFLQGRNHPEDIDDMIWLFSNFKGWPLFKKAIGIWTVGDERVRQLHIIGLRAQKKIISEKISAEEKKALILLISSISKDLTINEQDFSNTLGVLCRIIKLYIFIADVLIILIIVISSLSYAGLMISNLDYSKKQISDQNNNLQVINAGLDKFVSNVTHDLRSPLVSLMGLIELMDEETDLPQIKSYLLLMKDSLEKQERFISEMLVFIKSKHVGLVKKECDLGDIIDNVFSQNLYRVNGKTIQFYKEDELNRIESDALKLQVILNNLVSNSIKYSDPKKEDQWVKVKTYRNKNEAFIEVEDNGLGIRENDQGRIFDEFYLSGENKKSSGIGLYLVKDAVTQMNGRIEVKSEPGIYTRFTICIPG
jgi:signal transduction histidine kinase